MKVTYKKINGTLVTNGDIIQFVPDHQPYGPWRLTIHDAKIISIGGKEDDYAICVTGYIDKGNEVYKKLTHEPFFPRFGDML